VERERADEPQYDADGIRAGLDAQYAVEYHETISSSNDRARTLAETNAPETNGSETNAPETVVVADEQTNPRGREGRAWASPSGGVWFSLLLWPAADAADQPAFTLAMAVAVAEACRETGVDARIKWPNDVIVDADDERVETTAAPSRGGEKLCGVLTEAGESGGSRWLVIGVGLNANVDRAALPADAGATSLRVERGADVERRRLLQRILERFDDLRGDLSAVLPAWRNHAETLGRRVRVETPDGVVVGEAVDVEFPGTLVVETDEGDRRAITTGDCEHLRPVDDSPEV
jgi:BirA family biotin operon repressor/biotin-[acetyl-CoA-carboxylase] ligase